MEEKEDYYKTKENILSHIHWTVAFLLQIPGGLGQECNIKKIWHLLNLLKKLDFYFIICSHFTFLQKYSWLTNDQCHCLVEHICLSLLSLICIKTVVFSLCWHLKPKIMKKKTRNSLCVSFHLGINKLINHQTNNK